MHIFVKEAHNNLPLNQLGLSILACIQEHGLKLYFILPLCAAYDYKRRIYFFETV